MARLLTPLLSLCLAAWRPAEADSIVEEISKELLKNIEKILVTYGGKTWMQGYRPKGGQGLPLYVWLTGTKMMFNTLADKDLTYSMAERGYAAVQVYYPNYYYHDTCAYMDQKASAIFQGQGSALDVMCKQPYVDCSKGVAVHGFSQGAHLASLSPNYDGRITAVLLYGNGNFAHGATSGKHRRLSLEAVRSTHRCLRYSELPHLRVGKNKVRSIVGGHDKFMGRTVSEAIEQQEITTGYNCGPTQPNCIQPDGSGYYVITEPQSNMNHDFFCYLLYFPRNDWRVGNAPWCKNPSLDWLAHAALTGGATVRRKVANDTTPYIVANASADMIQEFGLDSPSRAAIAHRSLAAAGAAAAAALLLGALALAGVALALRSKRRESRPSAEDELLAIELQEPAFVE